MRGSVYQIRKGRNAGRWCAEIRAKVAGRPFRETAQFKSKREAEAQRSAWSKLVEDATAAARLGVSLASAEPAACPTFDELSTEYLDGADVRPTTRDGYEKHVRLYLLPFFGGLDVSEITVRHLRRFRTLTLRKHSPEGTKRIEATLRAMLSYAERGGIIDRSPCRELPPVRVPRGPGNEKWRVFEPAEVAALLDAADPLWHPWFLLAVRTGMRSGELRALRWEDLDLRAGWVTVARRASWVASKRKWDIGPPKSGSGRRIPLADDAREALAAWPRTLGTDLVLPAPRGGFRPDWMARNALRRAMRVAGVEGKARPHDARHTWASHLLRAGVDVETVRRLGGWSSLTMVLRYVHTGEDAMVDAIRRLQATS